MASLKDSWEERNEFRRRSAVTAVFVALLALTVLGAFSFLLADSRWLRPFSLGEKVQLPDLGGEANPAPAGEIIEPPILQPDANIATPSLTAELPLPDESRSSVANDRLLKSHYALLKAGRERFRRLSGYTAILEKRERIASDLEEPVTMQVKVRHDPFSVYMKWLSGDVGKEVLYVDGQDDGRLLVRLGGLKGRVLPALHIDPTGTRAMAESRYPVTKLGILALADVLIERRDQEMRDQIVPRVRQGEDVECGGRRCAVYVFEVSDRERSPVYRKSIQWIDREWGVPLQVTNYTWPEGGALDETTLIEYYKYTEIDVNVRFTEDEFARSNAEYGFRR